MQEESSSDASWHDSLFTRDAEGDLCMQGVETNLGELLLTAAHARADKSCVETQVGCWTFVQVALMTESIRVAISKALRRVLEDWEMKGDPSEYPPPHRRRKDEHVVMVVLDRGVECVAAVHAAMLARCAYNAFDVGEPKEKLKTWIEIARPPVMISSHWALQRVGLTSKTWLVTEFPRVVLDVHAALRRAEDGSQQLPLPEHNPEDLDRLAYLIFTSGTTGKPKGVMIRHKSALNVARLWGHYVGLGPKDRFAQVASMSWDVHILEVYGAMFARATQVTVPDGIKRAGPDMVEWLRDREITGMSVVPSHLRAMAGHGADVSRSPGGLPHLRILDVGGEALGKDVVDTWAPGRKLFNSYGPSEICVVCTGAEVQVHEEITIGCELPTYQCYVLDQDTLESKPDGERGVLFVGGIGLARGYLEEEDKTKSRFLYLPGVGRIYNTGDLVSRDELRRLHYHGRVDFQVKVRGIRIELEALEQSIAELPKVQHCEARVLNHGQRLVLLASGDDDLTEAELKAKAASLGRGYVLSMVRIIDGSEWKFNTSGKLLRNMVPIYSGSEGDNAVQIEHAGGIEAFDKTDASALELEIATCMAPEVHAEMWNLDSHFMQDLGFDSAAYGRLITLLRSRPKLRRVDLQMLFQHPSVKRLARCISQQAMFEQDSDCESVDHTIDAILEMYPQSLVKVFINSWANEPHRPCLEEACCSVTYAQLFRRACALQRLIRRALKQRHQQQQRQMLPDVAGGDVPDPVIALAVDMNADVLAGMVASMLEGLPFCVLDMSVNRDDLEQQVQLCHPAAILACTYAARWPELQSVCASMPSGNCILVNIRDAQRLWAQPLSWRQPRNPISSVCCVAFKRTTAGVLSMAWRVEHAEIRDAIASWCQNTRINALDRLLLALPWSDVFAVIVAWSAVTSRATLVIPPQTVNTHMESQVVMSAVRVGQRHTEPSEAMLLLRWTVTQRASMLACTSDQFATLAARHFRIAASSVRCVWVQTKNALHPTDAQLRWLPSDVQVISAQCGPEHWAPLASDQRFLRGSSTSLASADISPHAQEKAVRGDTSGTGITRYVLNLGDTAKHWGHDSWPLLCAVVQGWGIFSQPVFAAARMMILDRILLPIALSQKMIVVIAGLIVLLVAEQILRVLLALAAKWLLIGRYKEGDHAIYSLYYLKHWLVMKMVTATIIGQPINYGTGIGFLFWRNLALKMLGAKVSMSAVIMTPIVGFDLLTVGELATIHGSRTLTTISHGKRNMQLKSVSIGAGAYVGANCILEPGVRISDGSYVEPLSSVPAGSIVEGRCTGVPISNVGPVEPDRVPAPGSGCSLTMLSGSWALTAWMIVLPKAILPLLTYIFIKFAWMGSDEVSVIDSDTIHGHTVSNVIDPWLAWIPLIGIGVSLVTTTGAFASVIIFCRLMPKLRLPADLAITSIRAQIAAMKMAMEGAAAEILADASIVPRFIGACGAKIGKGCAFGFEVVLPETLVVGDDCFLATGNILTSLDLDQGRLRVPCRTVMDDATFLGNDNHVPKGMTQGCFAGVNTWLPEKPAEPHTSYFGNPALKFSRLSSRPSAQLGPEPASRLAILWHHFSSSVVDVWLFRCLQPLSFAVAFCMGHALIPIWSSAWDLVWVTLFYLVVSLIFWYIFGVRFSRACFHPGLPYSNAYYSTVITRWFSSVNALKVFPSPFQASGSCWHAPILRILGAHIGRRFFCVNENVLVDPPFAHVGDDVTVDYDAQLRCHSFEDFRLKLQTFRIGNGVTIMQGAKLAMSDAGEGSVLRPASVTWKNANLEPFTIYEGVPAAAALAPFAEP